ncbi:MAG: Uncharacterized protein G01um101472_261 [Parcubacteria group bacterium Gr01-1014_72]|nr:MAG: Uncharacterized protein G01um101472_261 [Parcubacteria group bacterium Gr01-1014_72]
MSPTLEARRITRAIYTAGFLFAVHSALPAYVNATFLSSITTERAVGIIFTVGSVLTILAFLNLAPLLNRFGNAPLLATLAALECLLFAGIAFSRSPFITIALFTASIIVANIIGFNFDVLLENHSENKTTGTVRGTFLSSINAAWLFSPLAAGFLLGEDSYRLLYLIAAVVLIPVIAITLGAFRNERDPRYRERPLPQIVGNIPKHPNTYKILMSNFILQLFFAWMVIYSPLYLHNHIGFSWQEIGVMFTIMLIPFVVLEAPLGRLADRRLGEKELLSAGFIIAALGTAALAFVTVKSAALFTALLFLTRVGASMIEIMNETYFFKKNDSRDADILRLFRMTRPAAYALAPLIATLLLPVVEFRFTFLALGLLTLSGLYYSTTLKDTR